MRVKQVVVYENQAQFTFWSDEWTYDISGGLQAVTIPLATQFLNCDGADYRASVINKNTGAEDRTLCKVAKTGVKSRHITREARIAGMPEEKRKLYEEIKVLMKQLARARTEYDGIDLKRKALEKLSTDVVDPKTLAGPFHMGFHPHGRRFGGACGGPPPPPPPDFSSSEGAEETEQAGDEPSSAPRGDRAQKITKLVSTIIEDVSTRINEGELRKCDLRIEIDRLTTDILAKVRDLDDEGVDLSRNWDLLREYREKYECRRLYKAHDLVIQVEPVEPLEGVQPTPAEDLCLKIDITSENASWEPQYEFKFEGQKLDQCEVEYHSEVVNNTGYDWVDCSIHLSTGSPTHEQQPPAPSKTVLSIEEPASPAAPKLFGGAMPNIALAKKRHTKKRMVTKESRETSFGNVRVTLPAEVSIKTSNNSQRVYMGTFELSAVLYHHIVPESGMIAYRVFCLSNTSPYTLFQTQAAKIFLDGKLIGRSSLADNYVPGSQLSLYAGADTQIGVRSLSDDKYSSTGGNFITGNLTKRAVNTAVELTNFHTEATVVCLVSHSLPASINSQVKVSVNSPVGKDLKEYAAEFDPVAAYNLNATYVSNPTTGSVIERVVLKPAQSHTSAFGYTIDWPQAEEIEVSG